MKRKIIAVTAAITIFSYSLAFAWLPAAYAVITALTYGGVTVLETAIVDSILVHAAIGVGGLLVYSLKNNGASKVDANGNINRESNVTWVELGAGNTLPVKQSTISGKLNIASLKPGVKDNKTLYPNLYNAMYKDERNEPWTRFMPVGTKRQLNGQWVEISQVRGTGQASSTPAGVTIMSNNLATSGWADVWYVENDGAKPWPYTEYRVITTTPPEPEERDPAQAINKLLNKDLASPPPASPENVYSDYYGEIDQYIKNNPNVVSFVDPVTGAQAKPNHATQEQVNAALAAQRAAGTSSDALESSQTAAQNARQSANAARAAANAAPGDAGLAAAAEAAERAADAAEAAAKKLEAEQAKEEADRLKDEAEKKEDESVTMPDVPGSPTPPTSLDFSGWEQLKSQVQSKFPFNLLSQVVEIVGIFTAEPEPPVFDLPIYGGNTIHIDLSAFDVLAQICRWGVAALISIAGLQYAIGWWRGVT